MRWRAAWATLISFNSLWIGFNHEGFAYEAKASQPEAKMVCISEHILILNTADNQKLGVPVFKGGDEIIVVANCDANKSEPDCLVASDSNFGGGLHRFIDDSKAKITLAFEMSVYAEIVSGCLSRIADSNGYMNNIILQNTIYAFNGNVGTQLTLAVFSGERQSILGGFSRVLGGFDEELGVFTGGSHLVKLALYDTQRPKRYASAQDGNNGKQDRELANTLGPKRHHPFISSVIGLLFLVFCCVSMILAFKCSEHADNLGLPFWWIPLVPFALLALLFSVQGIGLLLGESEPIYTNSNGYVPAGFRRMGGKV